MVIWHCLMTRWHRICSNPPRWRTWPTSGPMAHPVWCPIWFHWNGHELVVGSPPAAPKLKALQVGSSGGSEQLQTAAPGPTKYCIFAGPPRLIRVEGVAPEYEIAARHYLGEEAWSGMDRSGEIHERPHGPRKDHADLRISLSDFETLLPQCGRSDDGGRLDKHLEPRAGVSDPQHALSGTEGLAGDFTPSASTRRYVISWTSFHRLKFVQAIIR